MTELLLPLNTDVLLEIFDLLRDTSARTLLNVSLTCKAFHHLSRSFICSSVCFTFNRSRRAMNGLLIRRLLDDRDLRAIVRSVKILWAPNANLQPGEGSKEDLMLLGQAIPNLVGLSSFVWDAQYPIVSWLLQILRTSHPGCKLYVRHPASPDAARTLARLHDLPSLYSLDVAISAGQYQAFRELDRILISTSPKHLVLPSGVLASRHTLSKMNDPLRIISLESDGSIDFLWRLPFLWSNVIRLSFNVEYDFTGRVPSLDGLKILEMRCISVGEGRLLKYIVQGCRQLEVLNLTGYRRCVRDWEPSFWRQLGKTLIKLRLCENRRPGEMTTILSDSIMKLIARECPKLRSLGFDLDCDGGWPTRRIEVITDLFWNAVHFEFNIQVPHHRRNTQTRPTFESVLKVWTLMWQRIRTLRINRSHEITLPRLRSLDVVVDERSRFNVDLSHRDDEAGKGVALVRCAELEALKSKLTSSGTLWNREQMKILDIVTERATNGTPAPLPTTVDLEMVRPPAFWDLCDENRFYHRYEQLSG